MACDIGGFLDMRLYQPPENKPLISLTPLIDVVFILLIFFMLASSFMDWRSIEISVASAGGQTSANPEKPLVLYTYQSGEVRIAGNGATTDAPQTVAAAIAILQAQDTDMTRPILLKPAEEVTLQTSVQILEAFTKSGFAKVSFFTPQK
jgi:biopolymer transport protein ExbD